MSDDIARQIRKSREFAVTVGSIRFTCRRPTPQEVSEMKADESAASITQRFTVGWEGVTEDDLIGNGCQDSVAFTPLLWAVWCPERPDLWDAIAPAVLKKHGEYMEELARRRKNS